MPSDVIESAIRVAVAQIRRNQEAKRLAAQATRKTLENEIHELQSLVKTLIVSTQKTMDAIEARLPQPAAEVK